MNRHQPSQRDEWILSHCNSDDNQPLNKQDLKIQYIIYMLNRTLRMFDYEGLEDTPKIDKRNLLYLLQTNGFGVGIEFKGDKYILYGSFGGEYDYNYLPTKAIVNNPYLHLSDTYEIDKNCIIINNDSNRIGLMPLFNRFATLLADIDVSIQFATINARIPQMIGADNDNTFTSATDFIKDIWDGKKYGVIKSNAFFEGLKTHDFSSKTGASSIKDLIELRQYILGSWYLELGLNASFNMKRESINEGECDLNDNILHPLVDDMLKSQQESFDLFNAKYGTHIKVKYNSSWMDVQEDSELQNDKMKAEIKEVKEGESNDGTSETPNNITDNKTE